MPNELVGRIEAEPVIVVELVSGGGGVTDHALLTGRDKPDQHPIGAVAGLRDAINRIPPPVEAITNSELEELLK